MSTYVLGDIQGCYDEFRLLLEAAEFQPSKDQLWLAGDLVNRGPNNKEVLDYLLPLPRVTAVLGNHDLHFMAVASGQAKAHRSDTLDDLLTSPRLADYLAWLRQLPLVHHDPGRNLVLVHAGLPPQLPLAHALALAEEVHAALRGPSSNDFLAAMYGNEPDCFHEDLSGQARLRVITNYFTRLRYCTADGRMEMTHKGKQAPPGYTPWFSHPRQDDVHVLFGHWAALEGKAASPQVTALDTGCVWGRELTGLRLEDGKRFAVAALNRG